MLLKGPSCQNHNEHFSLTLTTNEIYPQNVSLVSLTPTQHLLFKDNNNTLQ